MVIRSNTDGRILSWRATTLVALAIFALAFPLVAACRDANASTLQVAAGSTGAIAPTDDQYGDTANQVKTLTAAGTSSRSSSSLPFTGFDAGLALIAGGLLVGTGLALRQAMRSGSSQ